MKKNHYRQLIALASLVACCLFFSQKSLADTVVIVHPSNDNVMTEKVIRRLFLSMTKSFPNGDSAKPFERKRYSDIRQDFRAKILGMTSQQLTSYWGRTIFTGQGLPPKEIDSSEEIKKMVASNPEAIAYLDVSEVDDTIKVVYTFN